MPDLRAVRIQRASIPSCIPGAASRELKQPCPAEMRQSTPINRGPPSTPRPSDRSQQGVQHVASLDQAKRRIRGPDQAVRANEDILHRGQHGTGEHWILLEKLQPQPELAGVIGDGAIIEHAEVEDAHLRAAADDVASSMIEFASGAAISPPAPGTLRRGIIRPTAKPSTASADHEPLSLATIGSHRSRSRAIMDDGLLSLRRIHRHDERSSKPVSPLADGSSYMDPLAQRPSSAAAMPLAMRRNSGCVASSSS